MRHLLAYSDKFMKQSNWKTLSLLKTCLLSLGIIIGFAIPKQHKQTTLFVAMGLFIITYIPLMAQMLHMIAKSEEYEEYDEYEECIRF